jgi:hypothetical protein
MLMLMLTATAQLFEPNNLLQTKKNAMLSGIHVTELEGTTLLYRHVL